MWAVSKRQLTVIVRAFAGGLVSTLLPRRLKPKIWRSMKSSIIRNALVSVIAVSALAQLFASAADAKSNQSPALSTKATPRSGNPIFEGWYADPEAAIF